jgi:hypothetical protein
MERVPEEDKEPEFRIFRSDISLEEIEFKRRKLPSQDKRAKVADAFHDAFELVGGVPRLALYADEQYGDFLRHYAKMIPRDVDMNVKGTITVIPALPPSALDEPIDVTPEGLKHNSRQLERISGAGDNPSLGRLPLHDRAPDPVSRSADTGASESQADSLRSRETD